DVLYPAEKASRPSIASPAGPAPAVQPAARAQCWLDDERANLVAATGCAATNGWPVPAGYLARVVDRYLQIGSHYDDMLAVHGHGLGRLGRHEEAVENLEQALAEYRSMGDRVREAEALYDLGQVYLWWGRYPQALDLAGRALAIGRETGDGYRETDTLNLLG